MCYLIPIMKPFIPLLIIVFSAGRSSAQQQYFEGTLEYNSAVQSKISYLNEDDIRKILVVGKTQTITCKNGNFKACNEYEEEYTIAKDNRVYVKFPKLDTLYYVDFPPDTAASDLKSVVKTDSIFKVDNYSCKGITITTTSFTQRFYYTELLRNDLAPGLRNTIGHYNVYVRETGGSMFLWRRSEYNVGTSTDSCIHVTQKTIDDHVFDLPALPQKKFNPSTLQSGPRFPGKEGAWLKYLQANLDSKLALKYVKIPKNEQEASIKVLVEFVVAKDGSISTIQIVNRKDVPSKLADEAVRVIQESPRWVPAQYYGQKITGAVRQPVVFALTR